MAQRTTDDPVYIWIDDCWTEPGSLGTPILVLIGEGFDGCHGLGHCTRRTYQGDLLFLNSSQRQISKVRVELGHVARTGLCWVVHGNTTPPSAPFLITSRLDMIETFNGDVELVLDDRVRPTIEREFLTTRLMVRSTRWIGVVVLKSRTHPCVASIRAFSADVSAVRIGDALFAPDMDTNIGVVAKVC